MPCIWQSNARQSSLPELSSPSATGVTREGSSIPRARCAPPFMAAVRLFMAAVRLFMDAVRLFMAAVQLFMAA
eukprot:3941092-Rhodomonas_salina.3